VTPPAGIPARDIRAGQGPQTASCDVYRRTGWNCPGQSPRQEIPAGDGAYDRAVGALGGGMAAGSMAALRIWAKATNPAR